MLKKIITLKVAKMPREIYPSSYLCDCGYQSDHFENTITELKRLSMRRPQRLGADDGAHTIVFNDGKMVAMWCPKVKKEITTSKEVQRTPRLRRVRKR
jgi:hypothetical protein